MTDSNATDQTGLPPGWYVTLQGHEFDLRDWECALKEPFDPVVYREPNGSFLLRSSDFDAATTADEVREKGIALVGRINGIMALTHRTRSVKSGVIIRVDEDGSRYAYAFAAGICAEGRSRAHAVSSALGPDGEPVWQLPERSEAQRLNERAGSDNRVADLLKQFGKADDWYEVYKTIERAEGLAGGEYGLRQLLGTSAADFKNLKQTANFYRHAKETRLQNPMTLDDAKSLLRSIVQTVLEAK